MLSFEVADCPVRVNVAETYAGNERVQKGSLILTVRNKTQRARAGRLSIHGQGATKPEWLSFEGALPTSPREIERDFKVAGSETVQVNLLVPGNAPTGAHLFNVRITAEDDPDNDFVVSPNVTFDVVEWTQAPPRPERFPWWAVAIAAVLLLLVAGALTWLLWPDGDKQVMLVNAKTNKCLTIAGGVSTESGVHAVQYDCDGDLSRRWWLNKGGNDYRLRNVKTEKCLAVEGDSGLNNAIIIQSDCDNQRSRVWRIGDISGPVQITNVATGKCITIAGGTLAINNLDSVQYNCDDDASRRWKIVTPTPAQ
ncbi:ricin-type beta-trefoil lectin domain protein [Bradyrhizobium japonicum]|uniref:RICIN domain-containing protein n=1 Tax=Bradyrhizobium japonicum TaxID=375 RepID=UPI001BA6DF09|nr:RICIN domain-containing protein [Bradyrhizobium japonicum]MBR0748765.1 ricin-type beta-trefoil lectin domain protein [Bradyrhizobium japonicum]